MVNTALAKDLFLFERGAIYMILMGRNRAEDARMVMLCGKREYVGGW